MPYDQIFTSVGSRVWSLRQRPPAEPAKVEGKWNVVLQLEIDHREEHPVLTLKQGWREAHRDLRRPAWPVAARGTNQGKKIAFAVTFNVEGTQTTGVFRGTVDGATMSGSVEFEGAGSGTWSAVRAKPEPPK